MRRPQRAKSAAGTGLEFGSCPALLDALLLRAGGGCRGRPRTGRVIVVSVIDNLVKGAAGQAIQNMNLMLGFAETAGLEGLAVFP